MFPQTWSRRSESNQQPIAYKAIALPIELRRHNNGSPYGNRTRIAGLKARFPYQLEEGTTWRLRVDSNHRRIYTLNALAGRRNQPLCHEVKERRSRLSRADKPMSKTGLNSTCYFYYNFFLFLSVAASIVSR